MGFFEELVLPEEPAEARDALVRLGTPGDDAGREGPPVDWFVPVLVSQVGVAGAGPTAKVMTVGWSVWPQSVTLHLAVFEPVHWQQGRRGGRQSGLRVGLALADGRRVTSLDSTAEPRIAGPAARASDEQSGGLVPLDIGTSFRHQSLFKTDVDLHLGELPPAGETRLVVEWPDEDIPETSTPVDADTLRAAASRSVEVWPDLQPPDPATQPSAFSLFRRGGPPDFLAPPLTRWQRDALREQEEARQRYVPRGDWERMGYADWGDAALIRARLEGGAPADASLWGSTPLHRAAERGSADAVAALLEHLTEIDTLDDEDNTALWHAVCSMDEGSVRALIDAGADVWTPQVGDWSPGRLLLGTPYAPLVADLPGAVPLPAEDAAAFQAADALIKAFGEEELHTEGLGIAFVRDVDGDELIRRLGADPGRIPETGPHDTPFDDRDFDASLRHVAVGEIPGTPGGCVLTQWGYMPSDDAVLRAITAGTAAYGVYFNAKGGTHGTLARDGEIIEGEEIGLSPFESDPPAYWHFRFWQRGSRVPYSARSLAYACAAAGMRVSEGHTVVARRAPLRWVELPPELRR
ncbi:ankyrin repeat domain-containing protein [Streptomyces flavofungini]|uniref:ankyrin repeat domain-containing protein n=1 Tax=Streptomyces flavofungini TaxID=68200 RepID=UPI0025AFCC5C|nr:ankyrin repeat domain-containing protein [Streptomyces flavofungini]WJV47237.1 ankyrin repeat domain-containing protein [Streptomyces flavofungini]